MYRGTYDISIFPISSYVNRIGFVQCEMAGVVVDVGDGDILGVPVAEG